MRKLPVVAAFTHAVQSTLQNLGFAFHASWMWLLVLVPLNAWAEMQFLALGPPDASGKLPADKINTMLLVYALLMVSVVIYASIAVNWHRYILKDEVPQGATRWRLDGRVWRYAGNGILAALMVAVLILPVALIFTILMVVSGNMNPLFMAAYIAALALVAIPAFYRLSIKLPAIAVDRQGFRFGDAWNVTRGNALNLLMLGGMTILSIFIFGAIFDVVDSLLVKLLGDWLSWPTMLLRQLINWVFTIFGITLLTSLYGFFVEQRDF